MTPVGSALTRWRPGWSPRSAPRRPWRGAPLAVTVGFAVLGEDGGDIETLLEAAEEARFAAAASGIGVIPIDDAPFRHSEQHLPAQARISPAEPGPGGL